MKLNRFAKYAWSALAFNIAVVLWGAVVRATSSGAGCGSHWPLCNGTVLPNLELVATKVEFVHRITSGLTVPIILILLVWAFRKYPKGHVVRTGASLSMLFILTEALVGAGLVLFKWVAGDTSTARVIMLGVHLINTFLLLASLSLTAWWASTGGERLRLRGQGVVLWGLGLGFLGVLLLGITGAITALGDTLFPSATLAEGVAQDFSPTAHFLIRLRVWHPIIAITVGFYLIFASGLLGMMREDRRIKRFSLALIILFVMQLAAGLINLVLLAPVWMQIIHLLLADSLWITLVLLAANTLAAPAAGEQVYEASTSKSYA